MLYIHSTKSFIIIHLHEITEFYKTKLEAKLGTLMYPNTLKNPNK